MAHPARRALRVLLLLALATAGCAHSNSITPWLRTHTEQSFELFAESGSHAGGEAWVERRVNGRWTRFDDASFEGFSFAQGTRAVLGDTLLTEDGRTIALHCDGGGIGNGMRVSPGGELLCVEVRDFPTDGGAADTPATVRVVHYDGDGAVRDERVAPLPLQSAPGTPLSARPDTGLVGFLGAELVFSVLDSDAVNGSWAAIVVKRAQGFALSPDGTWRELGTMRFQASEVWRIHSARAWREALGVPIETGIYPREPDGSPDW